MRNPANVTLPLLVVTIAAAHSGVHAQTFIVDSDFHTAALISADLDGDGRLDLVGASYYGDQFSWWRNLGNNQWERRDIAPLNGATSLCAADIDNDGDTDLLGISRVEGSVRWLRNDEDPENPGERIFHAHSILDDPNSSPSAVDAGDIDGDGDIDVVVSFTYDSEILILPNIDGLGESLGSEQITITVPGNGVSLVDLDDFDNDGDLDLIAATPWDWIDQNNYFWFRNHGNGAFGPLLKIAGGLELQDAFSAVAADINGDGLKDLVTMSGTNQMNRSVNWFQRMNHAGSMWSERRVIDDNFFGGSESHCISAVDIDNDGHLDIVAGSSFIEPGVRAWINKGRGERFCPHTLAIGFSAASVTAADFNNDGHIEIVAGSWAFYTGKIKHWVLEFESCNPCESDLNLDDTTDILDLLELFAQWGAHGDPSADLNTDGTVDALDLHILLASWGPC